MFVKYVADFMERRRGDIPIESFTTPPMMIAIKAPTLATIKKF
jgi:hypothetical protein